MPWSPHFALLTQRFHFMSIRFRLMSQTADHSDFSMPIFLFQFRICISIANSSKRLSCVSQGFETLPSIFPSLSQHLSSFLFQYFSVRILFIVIDLFFPSVHSQFIHTTTFFFVEGMSPVGSSLHHQPSQITCHIISLADLLLRDQIVVPITGQILADTLSLSHHLSHFHSVLSTQTTSPL